MKIFRPLWAEIDCDHLAHNLIQLRALVGPKVRVMAVVKADAYGHGAVPVSRALMAAGADALAVASLEEGIALREAGIGTDIMILGYTQPEWASEVVRGGFIQTVYHLMLARALSTAAREQHKTARIHVKIDTGMGRIGIVPDRASHVLAEMASLPGVRMEGIFTHLAFADVPGNDFSEDQFARFNRLLDDPEVRDLRIPIRHAANSACILRYPGGHYDMVRPGILLYGLYPSPELKRPGLDFHPVMTIKSTIVEIKTIPAGATVSYAGTFRAKRPTRVATLPAGYADGFSRRLSNNGFALVEGRRAPIIGNVCMDFTMLDVTDIANVRVNDDAVLVGRQGTEEITMDEIAGRLGTINYEVVSLIGKRVPRLYTNYSYGNPAEV